MTFSLDAIYHSASWAIYKHSTKLMDLQEKAATGLDINRVSDDPISSNRVLDLKADIRKIEVHTSTLEETISILDFSDSVLLNISGEVAKSMKDLTSVLSGILSAEGDSTVREQLAESIDSSLEQLVTLANTKRLGRYLFSGSAADVEAYSVERDTDGEITRVSYEGSMEERRVEVAEGVYMSSTLVGDDLFKADVREDPVFQGTTGAQAGAGTSSVRGDVWLEVVPLGGNNFDVSIDGGSSYTTVNSLTDSNIPIIHSDTGEVMYLDATGINVTATTTERVRFPGTYDMFNILISCRDMLRSQDAMSSADWNSMMSDMTEALRVVEQKVTRVFPVIGGKIDSLTSFKDSIEDIEFNTSSEISRLEDADIPQVALELARHEVLYEMSLNVASKMFNMSLLDFM